MSPRSLALAVTFAGAPTLGWTATVVAVEDADELTFASPTLTAPAA